MPRHSAAFHIKMATGALGELTDSVFSAPSVPVVPHATAASIFEQQDGCVVFATSLAELETRATRESGGLTPFRFAQRCFSWSE